MRRLLIVPDTHRPFHSKKAVRLLLKVAKEWKPDVCVVLGDYVDCLAASAHEKNLARRHDLAWELEDANRGLDELDAALGPSCTRHFLMGNHEHRLERYISQRAPELFPFVQMHKLLRLEERGWRATPYRQHLKLGKLHLTHDFGRAGPKAHEQAISDVLGNAVIGHTHHLGVVYQGNAAGDSHVGAAFGWLGDSSTIDYLHQAKAARSWHLGFGVGHMEEDGTAHLQAVPIIGGGRCVVDGVLYRA